MVDVQYVVELLAIMVGIKMILENYQPPVQKSVQAMIMLFIGGVGGYFLNPSKEGLIIGLVGGTVSFWGRDIFAKVDEIKGGK